MKNKMLALLLFVGLSTSLVAETWIHAYFDARGSNWKSNLVAFLDLNQPHPTKIKAGLASGVYFHVWIVPNSSSKTWHYGTPVASYISGSNVNSFTESLDIESTLSELKNGTDDIYKVTLGINNTGYVWTTTITEQ